MRLFRSDEHLERWLDGRPRGAVTSIGQLSDLAHAWWGDRLSPEWRPRSREQNQRILDQVGLTDTFWRLG